MKRVLLFFLTTVTIVVLLFGYHTSTSSKAAGGATSIVAPVVAGGAATTAAPTPAAAPTGGSSTGASATGGSSSAASTTGASTTAAPTTGTASKTVLGDSIDTRWGPVQVQITVQDGKITAVSVPVYPNNNGRDEEINATALPTLEQETMTAQTADIDMVSGATVTSEGYVTSLQSAIDKAGL